jgi:NADH:ubiquinone oxidoreductase subunit E
MTGNQQFVERLAQLPRERTYALPALLLAQRELGWVSDDSVREIARHLRLTLNDVESVATSYPEIERQPTGKAVIRVCTGASCWIRGADEVMSAFEAELKISAGQTSRDGSFTLVSTPCCFACAVAPVIEVNDLLRGRVNAGDVTAILASTGEPSNDGR